MKDKSIKTIFRINIILVFLALFFLITAITETATAKSLYVIADINANPQPLQAYDIGVDGTLAFQAEYQIPRRRLGGVGLAIDSDNGQLFVTYEMSEDIELVDVKTMTVIGSVTAPSASNLAGIVYDHDKGLLYCVDRRKSFLYVYDWEPSTRTLSNVNGSPFTLRRATAYGIALDEIDDVLYVANGTKDIYAYNTSTWALVRTISVDRVAISVAVDVKNGYLYSGGGYAENYYLTQYHLATDTENDVQVESDAGVMGLGVDTDTGYVYMSTGNDIIPGGDNLFVYDSSLNQIDKISGIGNPTGLVVPGKDIGYNPLNLKKEVTEGVSGNSELGEIQSVGAGSIITYTICFDNIDNDYTVTDLVVVDTLPYEVSFVSADEDQIFGKYDPIAHTYTWLYPSLLKGTTACLDLTVQVNQDVEPGTSFTNAVTINSNQTPPTTTGIGVYTASNILYIKKRVVGVFDNEVKIVEPGEEITYRIHFSNNDSDLRVGGITIVDYLPEELSFVSADYDQSLGYYDADSHAYVWRYPALEPGNATNVELTAKVNTNVIPGITITNLVVIDSDETAEVTSSVDVISAGTSNHFNLSKSVVGGSTGEVVKVGINENVTYCICFDGNDIVQPVTNVSLIDILPEEFTFVSADGDGIIGHYDEKTHMYAWSYPFISPGQVVRLELTARVNEDVALGKMVTNLATISSKETPPATASVDILTVEGEAKPDSLEIDPNDIEVIPDMVRRNGTLTGIMVVLKIPEGQSVEDNELLVLSPFEQDEIEIQANSDQLVIEADGRNMIIAVFDKAALMDAVPDYGQVILKVKGKFTSGQEFYGITSITITRFAGN